MKPVALIVCLSLLYLISSAQLNPEKKLPTVKTANGILQGTAVSGISEFKGIPFAQPPVGDLRWKEPQPVKNWEGTRIADHFGPRAMQLPVYSDMKFRSDGVSEDCLYLNVWTPAKSDKEGLPVLVYFYGGGFVAGDGSEFRYDGEAMARRGIVAVTVNYRLGVFGFLSHPDLTAESPHHASGNYGLLDQTEALRWIHKNIAAFGGDPDRITIAGESAGSSSVNAQVISPLPRNLFSAAIGESGSVMGFGKILTRAQAEANGQEFSKHLNVSSVKEMRALPADQVLQATKNPDISFLMDIDGYFFPDSPLALYRDGKVARVPLIVGWNSEESGWTSILGKDEPTVENYKKNLKRLYPAHSEEIFKLYPVAADTDVEKTATLLATERANAYGEWRWIEAHAKLNAQVYRYYYTRPRPGLRVDINRPEATTGQEKPGTFHGAAHSAEIEYALGNLPTNRVYDWQPDDYLVSAILQGYFLNFIRSHNPNGTGLPYWPLYQSWQKDPIQHIGVETYREADLSRPRFIFLGKISASEN